MKKTIFLLLLLCGLCWGQCGPNMHLAPMPGGSRSCVINTPVTSVGSPGVDTAIPTEKAVRTAIAAMVTNVLDFGADNAGAKDSKAAFDAAFTAIKTAGGGRLYVPKGRYVYNSSFSFLDTQTFTNEASNVEVFGDGPTASVINFTGYKGLYLGIPREDINRYCTAPPSTGCSARSWGLPSYYLIGNVSSGSSITMTTPAEAAHFTAGGRVFIESGD